MTTAFIFYPIGLKKDRHWFSVRNSIQQNIFDLSHAIIEGNQADVILSTIHMKPEVSVLLQALEFYGIEVLKIDGKIVDIVGGFSIEAEMENLYKLSEEGYVIGPFNDLNKLCRFIKQNH